jgi:acetyl esterase/lipase
VSVEASEEMMYSCVSNHRQEFNMASVQSSLIKFVFRRLNLFWGDEIDVARIRSRTDWLSRKVPAHRKVSVSQVDVAGVPSEWHIPENAPDDRALLYLHGGAWFMGSTDMYRAYVSKLAYWGRTKALVINYRLAPEHSFPAGLEDCITAFNYLVSNGIPPDKIVVVGDSAGGNLTLALLVALRDRGSPLPGAAVGISPVTDLTGSGPSYQSRADVDPVLGGQEIKEENNVGRWYAGEHKLDHPWISPLFADLHGLPPILLYVGDHEVLLDDSTRFAKKAYSFGVDVTLVVWPEMFHVFPIISFIPEAKKANRQIIDFIRMHQDGDVGRTQ